MHSTDKHTNTKKKPHCKKKKNIYIAADENHVIYNHVNKGLQYN